MTPWLDSSRIYASTSRDVLERQERGWDDRTSEQRSCDATEARARWIAASRIKPKRINYARAAEPKAEPSPERRAYLREYMRNYMRERKQRQKADAA